MAAILTAVMVGVIIAANTFTGIKPLQEGTPLLLKSGEKALFLRMVDSNTAYVRNCTVRASDHTMYRSKYELVPIKSIRIFKE